MTQTRIHSAISQERSGSVLGIRWEVVQRDGHTFMNINNHSIHLHPDELGSFTTHAVTGRWASLAELAQTIIRYHPDLSPLARRTTGEFPIV